MLWVCPAWSEGLNPKAQRRIDNCMVLAAKWAANPIVVAAVKAQNAQLPAGFAEMTQDKWTALPDAHPFVRAFTTNAAGQFLKKVKTAAISEAFLSDAAGLKVAFLAKTTYWCHLGRPKHDLPMQGKTWQGKAELDQSAGQIEVQIATPVLDGEKPIGSLVLGISLAFLADDE